VFQVQQVALHSGPARARRWHGVVKLVNTARKKRCVLKRVGDKCAGARAGKKNLQAACAESGKAGAVSQHGVQLRSQQSQTPAVGGAAVE